MQIACVRQNFKTQLQLALSRVSREFFFLVPSVSRLLFVLQSPLVVSYFILLICEIQICKQDLFFISKLLIRLTHYTLGKILTLVAIGHKHLALNFV